MQQGRGRVFGRDDAHGVDPFAVGPGLLARDEGLAAEAQREVDDQLVVFAALAAAFLPAAVFAPAAAQPGLVEARVDVIQRQGARFQAAGRPVDIHLNQALRGLVIQHGAQAIARVQRLGNLPAAGHGDSEKAAGVQVALREVDRLDGGRRREGGYGSGSRCRGLAGPAHCREQRGQGQNKGHRDTENDGDALHPHAKAGLQFQLAGTDPA